MKTLKLMAFPLGYVLSFVLSYIMIPVCGAGYVTLKENHTILMKTYREWLSEDKW